MKHEKYEDKTFCWTASKKYIAFTITEYFGFIGKVGMFISSALMAPFTITGFMLYFNRINKKKKII